MKAQKLPSGNWRVQVTVGKVRRSVTARTKAEAMRKAALLDPQEDGYKLLAEAAKEYIELKEPVISPSTHRGYMKIFRTRIETDPIGAVRLDRLNSAQLQRWVSGIAKECSPKTVRNCYGFISGVLGMFLPYSRFRVTLPQRKPTQLHTPTTDEVNAVLAVADPQLMLAILLGATGAMRRGEICALTASDVDFKRGIVSVTKSLAKNEAREWVIKPPKTDSSIRTVRINREYCDLMPRSGSIVGLNPDQVTMRFNRAVKKAGLPSFRFHDLRHYATSAAASSEVNAGSLTIQARGGWSTDHVMKRVYEHSMKEQEERDTARILAFNSKYIKIPKV